jgi:protein-S-isoprenylcysteine O-methyltransferase Ste14
MERAGIELLDWLQRAAVLVSYVLIAVELAFLPNPSEASAIALLSSRRTRRLGYLVVLVLEIVGSLLALVWCLYPRVRGLLLPLGPGPGPPLKAASIIAILGGSLLSLVAVLQLRSGRLRGRRGRPPVLYTRGLFSLSRNPIQLGMHLTWAGWVMALPSLVMLLALLFNLVHKHRRILLEESHLERVHGQSYREYLRKVGRYL